MLQIYVSNHCPVCRTAREHFSRLRAQYPQIPAVLIEIDDANMAIPRQVIGTPTYTWRERIIFRGNPTETAFFATVRELHESNGA